MGQKVNPIGFRVGKVFNWKSCWFSDKAGVVDYVSEDFNIRKFLCSSIDYISDVLIERELGVTSGKMSFVTVRLYSNVPSSVIGGDGKNIKEIVSLLELKFKHNFNVNVVGLKNEYFSSRLICDKLGKQVKDRVPYRSAIKKILVSSSKFKSTGIKISVAGRLNGAEIVRSESFMCGKISLHSIKSNVDFYCGRVDTVYGTIGIKVWVCNGNLYTRRLPYNTLYDV